MYVKFLLKAKTADTTKGPFEPLSRQ